EVPAPAAGRAGPPPAVRSSARPGAGERTAPEHREHSAGAEKGSEGQTRPHAATRRRHQNQPDDGGEQEPEHQSHGDVGEAEPAQVEADETGQPDVAEAEAP